MIFISLSSSGCLIVFGYIYEFGIIVIINTFQIFFFELKFNMKKTKKKYYFDYLFQIHLYVRKKQMNSLELLTYFRDINTVIFKNLHYAHIHKFKTFSKYKFTFQFNII